MLRLPDDCSDVRAMRACEGLGATAGQAARSRVAATRGGLLPAALSLQVSHACGGTTQAAWDVQVGIWHVNDGLWALGLRHARCVHVRKDAMRKNILVVEDNVLVGRSVRMLLHGFGYQALLFEDTRSALDHVGSNGLADIDLLLTDFDLPSGTGYQLIRTLQQLRPGLPAVLMSAWEEASIVPSPRPADWPPFILKPFKPSVLRDAVHNALELAEVARSARGHETMASGVPSLVEQDASGISPAVPA
ncbi:MAG: response regulator [Polyangiaceae bacterium]